ncbi:MAG: hypothetical protein ABSH52_02410 [Terriglobia bacterium]
MLSRNCIARFSLYLILLGLVAVAPVFAGSAVVGSVAGTMNATVGGQTLLPNTTLFSGDSLQVKDGVAVVALGNASRMVFGRDTVASFLRDSDEVTVLLGQGNVSVFHDVSGTPVRMKIGDVSVVPVSGFKTLGEVAMLNGTVARRRGQRQGGECCQREDIDGDSADEGAARRWISGALLRWQRRRLAHRGCGRRRHGSGVGRGSSVPRRERKHQCD